MTVQEYIDALPAERRPLYDRIHRLVLEAHPDAALAFSYQMPTFKGGRRRLYVGVWRHGVSMYGWGQDRDAGFAASSSAAPLPPMTFPCDRGHTGMITEPKIVERGYRRYVALRHTTDIPGLQPSSTPAFLASRPISLPEASSPPGCRSSATGR